MGKDVQAIAERADRRTTGGLLLARQAYYLIGFDASPDTMAWLAHMYRADRRCLHRLHSAQRLAW
jgi:hypothetical protein